MSGPKTYSYDIGNDITGAELLRNIRHIPGVQFKVVNGVLTTEVSSDAYYRGNNYSHLKSVIEQAKQEVHKNEELVKKDREKRKAIIDSTISSIKNQAQRDEERIISELQSLNEALALASRPYKTPFKDYSTEKQKKETLQLIETRKKELNSIKTQAEKRINDLSDFKDELDKTNDYKVYKKLVRSQPAGVIKQRVSDNVTIRCQEIEKELKSLEKFTDDLTKSVSSLKRAGLEEYIARLKQLSDNADPFSEESTKLISKIMDDINGELAALKSQRKMFKDKATTLEAADKRIEALTKLSEFLKPIYVEASKENKDRILAQEANTKLIDKIEKMIDEYETIDYIPNSKKDYLKSVRSNVRNARTNITKSVLTPELNRIAQELELVILNLKIIDKKHKKYVEEEKRYYDLCSNLGIADNEMLQIPSFEMAQASERGIDASLEDLVKMNNAMQNEFYARKRDLVTRSIASSNEGRLVSYEENDDITRMTYLRPQTKGVIYDVQIDKEGNSKIYPRGVILCNGKSICTKEQLMEAHSSCDWIEELDEKVKGLGISQTKGIEMSEEIKQKMYDEREYIRLNEEQSFFYLRMCGFTEEEIKNLGLISRGEQSNTKKDDNSSSTTEEKAVEI